MKQAICPFWSALGIFLVYVATSSPTRAQIIEDGTLPVNSAINTSEKNISNITGGTIAGNNLFHSFKQFNIGEAQKAYFVSPSAAIQNILARVTGGSRSEILGTLGTSGLSNPNLFLINPHGIVFGPKASLEVSASFVATTANAIGFGTQGFFSASAPNAPELLTVNPSAFLFNQLAPEHSITNQSVAGLKVNDGRSLLLVGGDVKLDGGRLQAPGGRVELGGVASSGTVELNVDNNSLGLSFPQGVQRADVLLRNRAFVDVVAGGGGSITISAQNLDIQDRSFLEAGIRQGSKPVGTTGNITLDVTEIITIANSSISNNVDSEAVGNTGSINIKAGLLSLTDGAELSASTFGQGGAGGIFLEANNSVSIANSFISSDVGVQAVGNAGGINIKAGSLSLTAAQLSASISGQGETGGIFVQTNNVSMASSLLTTGSEGTIVGNSSDINIQTGEISLTNGTILETATNEGRAGNIIIDARNTVFLKNSRISSDTFGSGNGGIIDIKARFLSLTEGAVLLSRTTGAGNGGNIQINASDVSISGVSLKEGFSSGLITASEAENSGQGGDISVNVKTGSLSVSDGAVLSARTRSESNGGNISVAVNTLELTNGGQLLTSAYNSGRAGNITVKATDRVTISGSDRTYNNRLARFGRQIVDNDGFESGLLARVRGNKASNAGDIEVTARSIHLDNKGTLSVETTLGEGGNITLNARDILLRHNSSVTTAAGTTGAGGSGGNTNIDTDVLVALENSDITANAFQGQGGNIQITAQEIFLSPESKITASSKFGVDGVVEINTPNIDPTHGLVNSPEAPVPEGLIAQGCPADKENTFTVTGRGGLPPQPGEALRTSAVVVNGGKLEAGVTPVSTPAPLVEAQGWVINAQGQVVLTSTPTIVTPNSRSIPPTCYAS